MARRKHTKDEAPEEKREEGLFDLNEEIESLDDITSGLPGMEEARGESKEEKPDAGAEEDSGFQTPEEILANFTSASRGKSRRKKKDNEDKPRRGLFGGRKTQSRLVDLEAEDPDAQEAEPFRKRHPRLRKLIMFVITAVLGLYLLMAILASAVGTFEETASLAGPLSMPQRIVNALVTPVQRGFSAIVDSTTGFFSRMALLLRIEEAYNEVVAENERMTYIIRETQEYEARIRQFEYLQSEMIQDSDMNPLACTVIGRTDGNYFSTFTINKGTADGVGQYMAVTYDYCLIGYTESVEAHSAVVRTIIDSEASIAALITSSRDQGTIRGTLGIDGTAMCRMYYLPEDHLPRPGDKVVTSGVGMSFPKGITIGTVRESTRGLSANKQFIVVEPDADFQHIEYVIVLRYRPAPEAAQERVAGSVSAEGFTPLDTARPYQTIRTEVMNLFGSTATPAPVPEATPEPSPTPSPTPFQTIEPFATEQTWGGGENLEYRSRPTPTPAFTDAPTPTPSPSPTPHITIAPEMLTLEEED